MAKMPNPKDVAARHQVLLERLKAGYVRDFEQAIADSEEAVRDILNSMEDQRISDLSRTALKRLLADLRDAQAPIYAQQQQKLSDELQALSASEALFEHGLVSSIATAAGIKRTIKKAKAKEVWSSLQYKPIQATGELLEPFLTDMTTRQINRVNREIMISMSQGRTISETVRAIRGTKAANYRDGVVEVNARDARSVVRTATQHVSQQSRESLWDANSDLIDAYQWVSTLDGKTSSQCRSLDRTIYPIGRGPVTPIHINCRSTTVPYFKPSVWDEGATRSAEFGPVDQNTSYYSWLKDQPVSFQDAAIGPVRGKLLRDGGLDADEFARLQLDKNFQPLTLVDMQRLNPTAFENAFGIDPKYKEFNRDKGDDKLTSFTGKNLL